ncbi:unnamed protein product [Diabrotica balteata]|uniref:Uncharacterized protein n=1 Tax=Diabrotica balteata TaxID=107213 RepID=A0A9N9X9R1_DIABA|nr:unnamed protein product [Diabrotica balteata]
MDIIFFLPLGIAILYLLSGIRKHKSYVGISAKTQFLYSVAVLVNCNVSIVYILLIVIPSIVAFALAFKMRDTYEKEADSFWAEILLTAALIFSIFFYPYFSSFGILSAFGDYIEAVAFIPQLYMMWNSKKTTKHMKVYTYLLFLHKILNILLCIYFYWFIGQYSIRYSVVLIINFLIMLVAVVTVRSKRIILHSEEEKMDTKAQNIFLVSAGLAPPITTTKPDAAPDTTNEVNKPSLV